MKWVNSWCVNYLNKIALKKKVSRRDTAPNKANTPFDPYSGQGFSPSLENLTLNSYFDDRDYD